MQKILAYLVLALCTGKTIATNNPVIFIEKYDRTGSAIVVRGLAKIIPPGTKMSVTVVRHNGKALPDKLPIQTTDSILTASDGTFVAILKKYGSLESFVFPDGKYELEFYAPFNSIWQTTEVTKRAGVKLDNKGRSDLTPEPFSLEKSSDLVTEESLGKSGRVLRAIRTIDITSAKSSVKTSVSTMRDFRADIDLASARTWLVAAEKEMKKARALFSNSPTDANIGTQSKRIGFLKDQGLSIFPLNPNWIECRAVAVNMWPLWWYGFRGKFVGEANAKRDEAEYGIHFQESVSGCKKILG